MPTEVLFTLFCFLILAVGVWIGTEIEYFTMMRRIRKVINENICCCGNCNHYDGDRCTKDWNNMDECYYLPDRDDKEPDDFCDDWERMIE